jgi:hypothetical protein
MTQDLPPLGKKVGRPPVKKKKEDLGSSPAKIIGKLT